LNLSAAANFSLAACPSATFLITLPNKSNERRVIRRKEGGRGSRSESEGRRKREGGGAKGKKDIPEK
jgi:hypothetical protein